MGYKKQFPRLGINIADGTTLANSGQVFLTQSNGVLFGMQTSGNSLVVTANAGFTAAIQSISAGTTQITSGQAVFASTNGLSVGINGQTITVGLPVLSYWDNRAWGVVAQGIEGSALFGQLVFDRVSFELPIFATRADVIGNDIVGKWASAGLGTWNITPGEYLVGFAKQSLGIYNMAGSTASLLSSATMELIAALHGQRIGGLNAPGLIAPGGGDYVLNFAAGIYSSTTNPANMPLTIHVTEINQTHSDTAAAGIFRPYFQLAGTF